LRLGLGRSLIGAPSVSEWVCYKPVMLLVLFYRIGIVRFPRPHIH